MSEAGGAPYTDKGNTGLAFYRDGKAPGDAIAEWNARLTQLTRAARVTVARRYHRPPSRTLVTGMSNGGYLVRWQLENRPELYDGGVDWEGTLWRPDGPTLLDFLPEALRHYPVYAAGGGRAREAQEALHAAGFPAGSEFLWPYHHDGATEAGTPYCAAGTPACDTDYDYATRPDEVRRAVARIGLTGRIGKPLITLHGTLDVLLPISQDSDVYARMVRDAGRGGLYRYYRIEGGTHRCPGRRVPGPASSGTGRRPPASRTVGRPTGAETATLVNSCSLDGR